MSKPTTIRVRMIRDDAPFRRGEELEVSEPEADKFVRQGVAELFVRETTEPGDEFQGFEPDTNEAEGTE